MLNVKYQSTQFVQIKHFKKLDSGEPFEFWRNALYVETNIQGNHVVLYTDGMVEVLHSQVGIRPVRTQEGREMINYRKCKCHVRETTEGLVDCPEFLQDDLDADCDECGHKFNCHQK